MGLCRGCPTTVPLQPHYSFGPQFCPSCSAFPGVAGHSEPLWAEAGRRGALDKSYVLMLVLPHS